MPDTTGCKGITQDQDFKQKINVSISFIMEIYRVVIGSFLLLFVPQKCGENVCEISDKLNNTNAFHRTILAFNALTCALFLAMYGVEIRRENKLITYLQVNPARPRDDESVRSALMRLSPKRHDAILILDSLYQRIGIAACSCFVVNVILSAIGIFANIYDNNTITAFITNILFMSIKLIDVNTVTNTNEHIFLSAYLAERVQYNDVDPDKIVSPTELVETSKLSENVCEVVDKSN